MKITLLTGKISDLENEFDFPLKVIQNRKGFRLTLRIDSRARQAVVSVPLFCSVGKVRLFIEKHREWIEDHLFALPARREFEDGEELLFLGKPIRLRYCPDSHQATHIENDTLLVSGERTFFHRRVRDFIKRQALSDFERRSKILAEKLGCRLAKVTLKDTTSRWGSCSSLNNINYSWRIALAPEYVIEYLMAHEVSHLKHHDHSSDFWKCVLELCPNGVLGRHWLKNHGRELHVYR